MRLYGLERLPPEEELLEMAELWRPYRSLAAGYLFLSASEANP
jgi:3-methyladenine DNA glycosylase/8-oxoguanine DNA glycosylase